MLRLLSLLLLFVAVAHAAEPEKLRSIAEGLTKAKGEFVFESLPSKSPSNVSFDAVEVSARTKRGLRLEGTAMRSLGVSLRGWKIGPCVGVGPFTSGTAGIFQLLPSAENTAAPGIVWTQVAATNVVPGSKDSNATTRPVKPGEAVALWPSLTQYLRNDGCGSAEGVLFLKGDGDELGFPLEGFLAEFPTESFETGAAGKVQEALSGGNGRSWIDRACARRCGIEVVTEKKPAAAAAASASEKKKP